MKVEYGPAKDEFKDAKITYLCSAYTEEQKTVTEISAPFERGENDNHDLFVNVYRYNFFDQYIGGINESHEGGVKPMIKERFGSAWGFLDLGKRLREKLKETVKKEWSVVENSQFGDSVKFSGVYENDFRNPMNKEFYPGIKTGNTVFYLNNHVWDGSISKKHITALTDNFWKGVFINVIRKKIGRKTTKKALIRKLQLL